MSPAEPTSSNLNTAEDAESGLPIDAGAVEDPIEEKLVEAISESSGAFWGVFLSTFVTIFLAEVGDKTQVATLLLSAQSQAPFTVFLGAGLALISTSLIGVLLGQWLSKRVSEETLDTCAGILLLLITIGLVGDIVGH